MTISGVNTVAQTVQTQNLHNVTLSGNTAGVMAQVSSGTMTLAGGNNITLSQNGNAVTISGGAGGAAGTNTLGMSNLGNTSGTTGVVTGTGVQFAFAGGNNITLSQSINASSGTITVSAASQSVQTQNRFNATLSGNTAGVMAQVSSGTLTLAGGNNVTLSQNGNAVTISAGAGGGGGIALANSQTTYATGTANLIEGGGAITIASTTGQSFRVSVPQTSSLAATGAVSISTNVSTISIGVPAFSAGVSNIGNTSGTSGTASNQVVFAGGNNITLSQSTAAGGNTITISAGAGGGGNPATMWFPYNEAVNVVGQVGQASLGFMPLPTPAVGEDVQIDRLVYPLYFTNASNSTGSLTASFWMGLYTRTNSSISLAHSLSASATLGYAGNNSSANQRGIRLLSLGWNTTIPDDRYYVGVVSRTTTAGTNASLSQVLVS
ncbi:MAG: hypothetical protein AAB834_03510, partial [Patescibacteria group bacterium]